MKIISINDIIFATVEAIGITRISLKLSGMNSLADIIAAIKREIGEFRGMLNISMRNFTQGWSHTSHIYI